MKISETWNIEIRKNETGVSVWSQSFDKTQKSNKEFFQQWANGKQNSIFR